jgi:hypothetical protein
MTALIIIVGISVASYVKTGRSPLWWAAMFFLFLEAVRHELWLCLLPAGRIFARRVRRRFYAVRAEIGIAV